MSKSLSGEINKRLNGVRKRKRARKGFASSVLTSKIQLVPASDDEKKERKRKKKQE